MKFLHTSDWHIGRTVRGRSREAEQHAAIQQVLGHAREQKVDCLLIAGDVFDSSAPSAEAERLVYDFFRELHEAGIPAVLIAGNHDHPRRFDAIAPLLKTVRLNLIGEPLGVSDGGVIEVESRDGNERALVAALPWISERQVVEFSTLQQAAAAPLLSYARQLARGLDSLATAFRPDRVSVLVAHLLVNDALVGPGGGERELHMAQGIYGLPRQQIPVAAQYTALGHVHKAQSLRPSPAAWYSGSLLQLDFGERKQEKSVNLVDVHAGQPAAVTQLPITAGRQLIDIGAAEHGVALGELPAYAETAGDAWLRVFVDLDLPVANLPQMVREVLPNAVHVERVRPLTAAGPEPSGERQTPEELFTTFYRSSLGRGREPSSGTTALFRRLLDEESRATTDP